MTNPLTKATSATRVWIAMGAIYVIWGSTYLGIRYAVQSIPPLMMMGTRHLIAGLLVYAYCRAKKIAAPSLRQWGYAAIAAAFLFLIGHGVLAWAEQKIPSGLAAVTSATLPLWTVLLARVAGSERPLSGRTVVGLLLGFGGVALLAGPEAVSQHLDLLAGVALIASVVGWAIGSLYSHGAKLPESTVLSAAMQMILGGAELFVLAGFTGEFRGFHPASVTRVSLLSLAYLIIFGSIIAFTAFNWLLSVVSASRLSTYAYVNPLIAVFLGWLLAHERLGANTLTATGIILAGVALVSTRTKKDSEARDVPVVGELLMSEGD